ncbi:MAG: hypothetical protein K1X82_14070, partial [Bacteroidia bacterium]|nr:hypothetical protein [Bacteroidia bacterium]
NMTTILTLMEKGSKIFFNQNQHSIATLKPIPQELFPDLFSLIFLNQNPNYPRLIVSHLTNQTYKDQSNQ